MTNDDLAKALMDAEAGPRTSRGLPHRLALRRPRLLKLLGIGFGFFYVGAART